MQLLYKILLLGWLPLFWACGEDEPYNQYDAIVYFEVDARSGRSDYKLSTPNVYATFEKPRLAKDRGVGYGGLLIFSSTELIEGTSFYYLYAYDLACPHEREPNVKVVPNSNNRAECPKCGSVYSLSGGTVISGKSQSPLVRYQAIPSNQTPGVFTITR